MESEGGVGEAAESGAWMVLGVRGRGMNAPALVVGDGDLGIWGALAAVFPEAKEQRCWNHRITNLLDKVSKKEQSTASGLLSAIPYAVTLEDADRAKAVFQAWAERKGFDAAARLLDKDWDRMTGFCAFPLEHRLHLRTTNGAESPFASVRLRTDAAKRRKKADRATAVVWKQLQAAESRFRRLNAPALLADVADGAADTDGVWAPRSGPTVA